MQTKKIKILPHAPQWKELFQREKEKIEQALEGSIIHHVGSTSITGLYAKPILDIIVTVDNPHNTIHPLESLGYAYRGEINIPFRFYFTKKEGMPVNLHLYEHGNPEIEMNLLFRDYLRTHPEDVDQYNALKAALLTQKSSFIKTDSGFTGYNLGKNEFIQSILKKAGFHQIRLMHALHIQEWKTYHHIHEEQLFPPLPPDQNHYHFVLYQGSQIVCVAHVELMKNQEAALRSFATDTPYQKQGFGGAMMKLLEKWILSKKCHTLKMHSRLSTQNFYRKLGYTDLPFGDSFIQNEYVDLGKVL